MEERKNKNILGGELRLCGVDPLTGFYRDGYCRTEARDVGSHTVAAIMTDEFLAFSKAQGNDLQTPRPEYDFPGLKAGDRWCVCAPRWKEAEAAGFAPPIDLHATDENALDYIPLDTLKRYGMQ